MTTLLQVNSSIFSDDGQSTRLADEFVANWRRLHPATRVMVRDLAREPVPHLHAARFRAFFATPAERDAGQRAAVACSDRLIGERQDADVIVIGLPMYNFGIPSTLKACFDHVARSGITFRYMDNGPVGLLEGKKVFVLAARGGRYAGTDADTQTPYVAKFLAFLGIEDVEFICAEGLNKGDSSQRAALGGARETITRLAA